MRRFYVEPIHTEDSIVKLSKEESHHIVNVLRMNLKEQIILYDGSGTEYIGELVLLGEHCEAGILDRRACTSEPTVHITLYQGLPKADKMETVVQKCTETGIYRIVPVMTARSAVKLDEKDKSKKRERWQRIALEACKQCQRARVPEVALPQSFRAALEQMQKHELIIVPYEQEQKQGIRTAVTDTGKTDIAVFIGPEGGIADEEMEALTKAGGIPVTLGPRILRTETVGIIVTALILGFNGQMGG